MNEGRTWPGVEGVEGDFLGLTGLEDEAAGGVDEGRPTGGGADARRVDDARVERRARHVAAVPQDAHVEHAHLLRRVAHLPSFVISSFFHSFVVLALTSSLIIKAYFIDTHRSLQQISPLILVIRVNRNKDKVIRWL